MSVPSRGLDVRPLTEADDLEPELDLNQRAFGTGGDREWLLTQARGMVRAGRLAGAFDGPAMVASARYLDLRQ